MNPRKLTSKFLSILAVVSLMIASISCSDTETTDSTNFMIYYTGVTDIGPSMNFNLNPPTYKGAAPSSFAITKVTFENEPFTGESFIIDDNTGAISISNTAEMPVGIYRISVSCISNGQVHNFKDAIEVNMMAPVPDGVTVEPSLVEIDFAKIKTENKTAQVKTDGAHVSITGYEVIQEADKNYFAVSKTGEISVNSNFKGEIPPGIYKIALKLTTNAGKCIYEDAVTFNITSSPLALTYTPDKGSLETNYAFASAQPVLKGSIEELSYAIKAITPATDKISIDPATGILSIAASNNMEVGTSYVVDITATNKYGSTDFDHAYSIDVVAYIAPIENFAYTSQEAIQNTKIEIAPNEGLVGGMVTFSLVDLPAALSSQLTIDAQTGIISAKKGNSIAMGTYPVKVKAVNSKGEKTAEFTLTITQNNNIFTYIRYGNNLNLSPAENYANQFRVRSEGDLRALKIKPIATDANPSADIEWTVTAKYKMKDVAIDSKTGELTFADVAWREPVDKKNYLALVPGGMVMVNATAGKGTPSEFTLSIPVFFHFSNIIEKEKDKDTMEPTGVRIEYTPFVLQVNPVTGGKSEAPLIEGADKAQFSMDYRRSFNYWNIGANHKDGAPKINPINFMGELWDRYYKSLVNQSTNVGSKDPMSYFSNIDGKFGKNLGLTLGYVDHTDKFKVRINPNKWRGEDNVYANGVMIGQMTFVTNSDNGTNVSNGAGTFPLFIWFDEKY